VDAPACGGAPAPSGSHDPSPVAKKSLYLQETVPSGRQAQEAEKLVTRFLNQADEGRNPKTRANVGQLIAKYFEVVDVDVLTLRGGYRSKGSAARIGDI
jgi:integrase